MNESEKTFFGKLKDDVLKQLNFKKKYKNLLEKKTFFYNYFFNGNSSDVEWGCGMSWFESMIKKNWSLEECFDFHKDMNLEISFYKRENEWKKILGRQKKN